MVLQKLIRRIFSRSQQSAGVRRLRPRNVSAVSAMIELLEPRKMLAANVITLQNFGSYVYLTDYATPKNAAQGDAFHVNYNANGATLVGQNGTKFQVGNQLQNTVSIASKVPLHFSMSLNSPASNINITGDGVTKLASVDLNFGYFMSNNSMTMTSTIVDSVSVNGSPGINSVILDHTVVNSTFSANLGTSSGSTLELSSSKLHGNVTGSAEQLAVDYSTFDGLFFVTQLGTAPTFDSTTSTYNGMFLDLLGNDAQVYYHGSVNGPNTFNSTEILIGVPSHETTRTVDQIPSAPSIGVVNNSAAPLLIGVQHHASEPVLTWTNQALLAIEANNTPPPLATRALAIMQAAMLDAINAIDGTPYQFVKLTADKNTSAPAAVDSAADTVLVSLFPAQKATFDAVLAQQLSQIPNGAAKDNGVKLGKATGNAMIVLRQNDGYNQIVPYTVCTTPGSWQPTPLAFAAPLLPGWGNVNTFVISNASKYVPPGPPAIGSAQWTTDYNEVQSLGAKNSTTRTADETQIALFWADGGGTFTPPGHWNAIASQQILSRHLTLEQSVRLMAELNLAMADAAIVAWKTKYQFNSWRPITAIQNITSALDPNVTADPNWQPLLTSPNFPEYISGHSTFSGTAAEILTAAFGDNVTFTTTSPGLLGVQRTFTSFWAAANEAGRSRIYGGIHFEFSNQDGLATGKAIGDAVLKALGTP